VSGEINRRKCVFAFGFLYKTYVTMLGNIGIVIERRYSTNNEDSCSSKYTTNE
jgi:hypothetical protein